VHESAATSNMSDSLIREKNKFVNKSEVSTALRSGNLITPPNSNICEQAKGLSLTKIDTKVSDCKMTVK
jgi:hypothetical protein